MEKEGGGWSGRDGEEEEHQGREREVKGEPMKQWLLSGPQL